MELLHYFDYRFNQPEPKKVKKLPFITISRKTGCDGILIAKLLVKEFKSLGEKWKYIDKEILNDSAKKLKLNKSQVNYVFEAEMKTHADEILAALSSRYYKSDKAVRKAVAGVVKHYAMDGRVIIVGRGGAPITADMKYGVNVRLDAPISWRIESLMKRRNSSHKKIEKFILDNDLKREKLLTYFCNKASGDMCFDLTINCAKFTPKEIAAIIISVMKKKKLIKDS